MATYRFSAKVISRSSGRSATGATAYRSGERIRDERTGETFDFTRRSGVLDSMILAPIGSPEWVYDRAKLWNRAELAEKRKDAQIAREIQVSLPCELSLDANRTMLHAFVHEQFVQRGMVADVAIHSAHRGGDDRNVHAHVLLTLRELDGEKFGGKAREWNARELLETWRPEWARAVNSALEIAHVAEHVDHRSYAARGIDREPEPKQGPFATAMERLGHRSRAGDERRRVQERNASRDRLHADARRVANDLREIQYREAERQRHATDELRRPLAANHVEQRPSEPDALGIGSPSTRSWQRSREQVLSEAYARDMAGSELAKFWRVERTPDGLAFTNARGRFEDHGYLITARNGNDLEVRGMLDLAAVKGWTELHCTGSDDFKRKAMAAALHRGFVIEAHGRDAELLREIQGSRSQRSGRERAAQRDHARDHAARNDLEREL